VPAQPNLRRHGGVELTVLQTVLVFVGIPLAVVLLIYVLVFAGSSASSKRYRPGRPYNQTPVWYIANKPGASAVAATSARQITGGSGSAAHALSGGTESSAAEGHGASDRDGGNLETVGYGETGGASDSW
jgi:hypothetical protein